MFQKQHAFLIALLFPPLPHGNFYISVVAVTTVRSFSTVGMSAVSHTYILKTLLSEAMQHISAFIESHHQTL
jgi:hypothetical protein